MKKYIKINNSKNNKEVQDILFSKDYYWLNNKGYKYVYLPDDGKDIK